MEMTMNTPGYESLRLVLQRAYNQAAHTKGAERHANSKPFHEQPMQTIAAKRGIGFLLGQADKKTEEAQGMLARGETSKAIHELLGAINYIAGAIIFAESQSAPKTEKPEAAGADQGRSFAEVLRDEPGIKGCGDPNCIACGKSELPPELEQAIESFVKALDGKVDVQIGVIRL